LGLDFHGFSWGFPTVEGMAAVMVIHSNTVAGPADLAAKLFFTHVVKIFGRPEDIVSDRDPKFTGRFSTALFNLMGFDLKFFTSYHP
jgi:hypothetical protein